ncbi:TPA: hypothetical protein IE818_002137 [Escherichia coli]|nr:hypothetical protein [Escherichia coli]EFD3076043.1 hypothetical protein [Escherichia coli]EFD3100074.1 hypothetical protein [Escherichia coli]EFD3109896.1 hypothetical protein [Escherichia coli]EFM3165751.1 hypothetical protein [Escherichia coli]
MAIAIAREEFPAPAGINRGRNDRKTGDGRVPRASGDKPRPRLQLMPGLMSSPRQRG